MSVISELVVVAIDFGTTFSGYGYSYKDNPEKVFSKTSWSDGTMMTPKAPTAVLFDKSRKFHSFGYEAETKYAELANTDQHVGWRFFRRFKMQLFQGKVRLSMKLKDEQGEMMAAIDVFAAAIYYLKQDALDILKSKKTGLSNEDIRWVLTVPAIWEDAAKQFMTEAAKKAGIPENRLTLALEPEAAAVYCKTMSKSDRAFKPGSKFMIADLGGGTVDISAHEVQREGTLASLSAPSGGPWGGILVDNHLNKFLLSLFTQEVLDAFSKECKPDKLEMDRIIELKKRTIKPSETSSDEVHIKLPNDIYEIYNEHFPNNQFETSLRKGRFSESVRKKRDRLHITTSILTDAFNESKEKIVNHLKQLLQQESLCDVRALMLVGGFSDSEVIRKAVQASFPQHNVMSTDQGSLAVVMGAVMFGHNPKAICSRKMQYTYGVSTSEVFVRGKHSDIHRHVSDGIVRCEDIFKPFFKVGDIMSNDKTITHSFNAPSFATSEAIIEIYKTKTDPVPMYVTECNKVAELKLTLSPTLMDRKALIDVFMKFGETQITVSAKEHGSVRPVKVVLDVLK